MSAFHGASIALAACFCCMWHVRPAQEMCLKLAARLPNAFKTHGANHKFMCVQVLRLPWVNPVEGSLAPSLSALTSLTSLLIRHPYPPEQQALPCSLVELTVAQELPPIPPPRAGEGYSRPALPPLKISHLTALKVLQVKGGRREVPSTVRRGMSDCMR